MEELSGESGQSKALDRPAISVCMATFNGERYIAAQLESILKQLSVRDEVLVVDDASTDKTRDVVRAFRDSRIRLQEHERNAGVLRTFEDAIRAASNDILFLSDQDDIWVEAKVETILAVFASYPEVTLIATDAAIIDANGNMLHQSYFEPRGSFHPGFWHNLVRNRFGGCTMAFRSSIIPDILPLPHGFDVLHDAWIGAINSLSHHETLYINRPLVLNRRHLTTVTGRLNRGFLKKVMTRVHMLSAVVTFLVRRRFAHRASFRRQRSV